MLFKCVTYQLDKIIILDKLSQHNVCGILHDKDENKKNHIHFIIEWEKISPIKLHYKLTEVLGELTLCKTVFKFNEDYDYLTHKHNRQKYHYDPNDIFCNNEEYFRNLYTIADYSIEHDIITDLQNPNISFRTLAEVYGLDFVKNLRTYVYFREMCMTEDDEARKRKEREERIARQEQLIREGLERRKLEVCEMAPFPLDVDEVSLVDDGGLYSVNQYIDAFQWYRKFYRNETAVIKTWCYDLLPDTIKIRIDRLTRKRQNDGIAIVFDEPRLIPAEYMNLLGVKI